MNHCFICGMEIGHGARVLRRKVKTGEWKRRGRAGTGMSLGNVHFGMRVVCGRCAKRIDRERRIPELLQYAELALALAVFFWLVLSRLAL